MSLKLPKCDFCKNIISDERKYRCIAFPEGIPLEKISDNEQEECANGIKFEEEPN